MTQVSHRSSVAHTSNGGDEHSHHGALIGPILCWAVVFADIGTSVYYVPGILYQDVGLLAGFFVILTMSAFVLLSLKYAEVTERFPGGGGVVAVAASAINKWCGALGGCFIQCDYFLTASISIVSGFLYLAVVLPEITPYVLEISIVVLVLLGILNWWGIGESAKVSLVAALIAFVSDIAVLVTVFSHISFRQFLALFPLMFAHQQITPLVLLLGFSGSFLAFSGLESISQLAPMMHVPRKAVTGLALLLVVLTIGVTSPVLTLLSTTILPKSVLEDAVLNQQVISLLAGSFDPHSGWSVFLQTEVAISACSLLTFASNTAIIGSYNVFLALSRMEFFPRFILKRNRWRNTPHNAIGLSVGIPIIILLVVQGNVNILGDMYAFGLLGAFSLTCIGLDIVRRRELKAHRERRKIQEQEPKEIPQLLQIVDESLSENELAETVKTEDQQVLSQISIRQPRKKLAILREKLRWVGMNVYFYIGVLTTFMVLTAWATNLVHKHLATAFGLGFTCVGMLVAVVNYKRQDWHLPVVDMGFDTTLVKQGCTLAVVTNGDELNESVLESAIEEIHDGPTILMYLDGKQYPIPEGLFLIVDRYYGDDYVKGLFSRAEKLAKELRSKRRRDVRRSFKYVQTHQSDVVVTLRQILEHLRPHELVVSPTIADKLLGEDGSYMPSPTRIRFERKFGESAVVHLMFHWQSKV